MVIGWVDDFVKWLILHLVGVLFRGCVSKSVASGFCYLTARPLRRLTHSGTARAHANRKYQPIVAIFSFFFVVVSRVVVPSLSIYIRLFYRFTAKMRCYVWRKYVIHVSCTWYNSAGSTQTTQMLPLWTKSTATTLGVKKSKNKSNFWRFCFCRKFVIALICFYT